MEHELWATRPHLHGRFSRLAKPVLEVESGDTVCVRGIPDVSWGLEPPTSLTSPRKKVEPRDPKRDAGPCMAGPIAVRGAEPGDALEIEILRVVPAVWGWTYAGRGMANPAWNEALGVGGAPLTLVKWTVDRARGVAVSELGTEVAIAPFTGTIGLAPDEEDACGWTPRMQGGNMDCAELVAGAKLYLPVAVAGGMLSLGDGHVAQRGGELSGTAIESLLEEVVINVRAMKGLKIGLPRARTREGWVTMGFGKTMDEAAAGAVGEMLTLMEGELGIGRAEALALASSAVDLRVTQVVNPLKGMHAVWGRSGRLVE